MTIAAHGGHRALNGKGLSAMGLVALKPNGTPWNVANAADRKMATKTAGEEQTDWTTGSTRCTAFCDGSEKLMFTMFGVLYTEPLQLN